MLKNNWKQL